MWTQTRQRFSDLAQAFDGSGGYAPVVRWRNETLADGSTRRLPDYATASFLVPYARESAQKYAGRAALATYENHLRSACERFCGFLARRRAVRRRPGRRRRVTVWTFRERTFVRYGGRMTSADQSPRRRGIACVYCGGEHAELREPIRRLPPSVGPQTISPSR